MANTINTKHDTASYEKCGYKREILLDLNAMHDAFQKVKKESDWKAPVQRFEMNLLPELIKLQNELRARTYRLSPTSNFILNERGKARLITGDDIRDRVVKSNLCDNVLIPSVRKYLIHDNGASLRGKGISFTRERLDVHLKKFYQGNKSNEGFIYLSDYTKFFDNVEHERLMGLFKDVVSDELALWLLDLILKESRVDVSYMSELEFADRFNLIFNSLEHRQLDKSLLTGERFLEKHVNMGDQVSQVSGVYYPSRLDNYIKIVEGVKYYGRYMDDTYIIHKDKDYLIRLSQRIEKEARNNGLFINRNKTRICKVSDYWRFLQIQYSLTDTGRIIKKINPERIVGMRRKLRSLAGVLPEDEFSNLYNSWFGNHHKIMSKLQRENMNNLFYELKEEHYAYDRVGEWCDY